MRIIFVGPKHISQKASGGQRRFMEAVQCCGLSSSDIVSSPWEVLRLTLKKNITYIVFDERYLITCIFALIAGNNIIFFPRGNKIIHYKYKYSKTRLWVYRKIFSWLYSKCKMLVFQTNAQANEFHKMYSYSGPIALLPNNINASWIKNAKFNEKQFNYSCHLNDKGDLEYDRTWAIGFLGGLNERKGFSLAYSALYDLIKTKKVSLNVAGEDSTKFSELDVVSYGYISGEELINFYKKCDFILIPSEYDSFPNVILESLAYGAIPLISRDEITEEIFGENSILLFHRNKKDIEKLIVKLTTNPALLQNAYDECCDLISKYTFDWCHKLQKIIDSARKS